MSRAEREEADAVDEIVEQWGRERPDLDPSPISVFGRLHRSYLRYQDVLARTFGAHDVNAASFDVLASLRRSGAPYRRAGVQLAREGLLSSAGTTLRLDRLEQQGLIERQRDPHDRRVVYSSLTPAGLALIDALIGEHLAAEEAMLANLTATERRQLSALLRKLESSITAEPS
ncbi:MAG: MarR family transcriptional regulator [Actinobacteria bacterium]|nr:MarR family transcriptional regulator [Actinomycetota bacterium]